MMDYLIKPKLALIAFLSLFLTACSGGIAGTGTGSGSEPNGDSSDTSGADLDDGFNAPESSDQLASVAFNFIPDEGIRLACASVPRVGKSKDEEGINYYLYHSSHLDSGSAAYFATSADGFQFSASSAAKTKIIDNGEDQPPIATDRTGFPEIVEILPTEDKPIVSSCENPTHRIFHHNGALGGFGDGITSDCSDDGQWFIRETEVRVMSPDGGNMGVTTAFRLGSEIHLFTMDGKSPNDMGEYRHRVWQYKASDGRGDTFALVSDDPLMNGMTVEAKDRQNDPMSYQLSTGDVVLLTMKQHNGPINPPNITGEIYGWHIDQSSPDEVAFLPPENGEAGDPLIAAEDFAFAGHGVFSINDPAMIQLADGAYRLYVGALVNRNAYPEVTDLSTCDAGIPGGSYSWVILSATSAAEDALLTEEVQLTDALLEE